MLNKIIIYAVLIVFTITVNLALSTMEYPQGLKKVVEPYPNSKIIQTVNVAGTVLVILEAADTPGQVFEFYKKELAANNWKIMTEVKQEGHNTIISEKGSHNLVIDIGVDQTGKSKISLSLAPK